ncbi:MAG: MFS transporter, partial [Parachlamydiaceae bacterium]|nr:MFS transporter [Parachlamydiaceae bacterium]
MNQSAEKESLTRAAFMWTSILNTPFWAIFNMLPFILYKDLNATPFQITVIIVLKPAVSLIALYWSALIEKRKDRLITNLILGRILAHLPFFFFPFVHNTWFFIASFGFYMILARGTVPAWMEVLKLNIPDISRERIFAYGSAISYIGMAIIPFVLGSLMDDYTESWRWIFPVTALISLSAIAFKSRIPIFIDQRASAERLKQLPLSFKQVLIKPWKSAWELICRRPDFARFQLGFMLGGSGLIIMQPALPIFFMDKLHLSYTELAVALTLCKGVGFAATSPWWARLMNKVDMYRFNSYVTLLCFIFPFCLIAAQFDLNWLYGGYVLYGVMQGGSELSWHLSGPRFAKDEDSSGYSSLSVLSIGLRGCFVPAIGSLLCYNFNPIIVMLIGGLLCLMATLRMS